MVSHADRRRARRIALIVALAAAASSCSRHADIKDEPDSSTDIGPDAPKPDGGLPVVEGADLADPRFPACEERAEDADCRSTNDFFCDFPTYVPVLAERCQATTGCATNGWVEIELGSDGCGSVIRMDQPQEDFVACLVEELGNHRCPCGAMSFAHFLGVDNQGCETGPVPCGGGEFRCDPGFDCIDGLCVSNAGP